MSEDAHESANVPTLEPEDTTKPRETIPPDRHTFEEGGYRVTRIDVGTPADNQERSGLILARAQQWVARIRAEYLLKLGPCPEHGWIKHSFDALQRLTDIAQNWTHRMYDDHEQRINAGGSNWDGFQCGDYAGVLKRFCQTCKKLAADVGALGSKSLAECYLIDEMVRLPADLDHHQAEYERAGYHMDICCKIDHKAPSYDEDDAIPQGGAPVEAEPLKEKKRTRTRPTSGGKRKHSKAKRRRRHGK